MVFLLILKVFHQFCPYSKVFWAVLFVLSKFLSPWKKPEEEFSQLISERKIKMSALAQNWGRREKKGQEKDTTNRVGEGRRERGRREDRGVGRIRICVTQDPHGFSKASSMLWSIKQYQVRMTHDQEGNCQCSSGTSSLPV